jgi:hypothetical protein
MAADLLLHASKHHMDGRVSMREAFEKAYQDFEKQGFDGLTRGRFGDRAYVRRFEVMAAANRLRTLKIKD